MLNLDKKNRKLLYFLSLNSRYSQTQLSQKLGLSKNAVKYRIESLKQQGIISKFASVINLGSLGYTTITLLLKFNEDIYEKPEIIDFFKNYRYADWVVTLSGQWDIFAEIVLKDLNDIYIVIGEIVERFNDTLCSYQLYFSWDTLKVEHLIEDFSKEFITEPQIQKKRTKEVYHIDDTDKKILREISQDSSMPYLHIAQKIGTSIDVVSYRMRNLIDKGVIVKFFAEIPLKKLGYTEYLYTLRLKNLSKIKVDAIKQRIRENPNVTYAFLDITSFQIVFVCAFANPDGIDHLSRNLRKEFLEIIDTENYQLIKEQILFNLFPSGI